MKGIEIKKPEGKLGVLLVGLGAVSTTFIAGVEAAILSGKDSKGNDLPEGSIDAYLNMYNKNSKDTAYVKSVTKPKPLYQGSDRFWPGTGGEVTYSKVPKTQRIRVQKPTGEIGHVSAGSLQEALNSGYKQVD